MVDYIPALLCAAEKSYREHEGKTRYRKYKHRGVPRRYPPFNVYLPMDFLGWDTEFGVLAFPKTVKPYGRCRCGVVEDTVYFQLNKSGNVRIGVKVMVKKQIQVQKDDVENELRVMNTLQPAGLNVEVRNEHFLKWECGEDEFNEYIAIQMAEQGSLIHYFDSKNEHFKKSAIKRHMHLSPAAKFKKVVMKEMARRWMKLGISIFYQLLQGIVYMHGQNVCHLDLDPCNLVMDSTGTLKIIDFGSSAMMTADGLAGVGSALVKFKPLFVAPEVRTNNRKQEPRPGFNGRAADLWSIGVLLYQLLCWGYPGGSMALSHDLKWYENLLKHANGKHQDHKHKCYLCYRRIEFTPTTYEIFKILLHPNPLNRSSATHILKMFKHAMKEYGEFPEFKIAPTEAPQQPCSTP